MAFLQQLIDPIFPSVCVQPIYFSEIISRPKRERSDHIELHFGVNRE